MYVQKKAHVLTDWKPTERLFSPTKGGVDPRLFDADREMLPGVRKEILDLIDAFWMPKYGDWRSWARVYLAGSQASEWYGNNDFDLLLGVNYEAFRKATGATGSNEEITRQFNHEFQTQFNDEHWHPKFDPEHEWHRTGYVNKDSYDIRAIKPYAAYDVGDNTWAVEPIHEPTGHQFSPSEWYYMEGFAEQIKAAMELPEPARKNALRRIWHFLHADRSRAFGPHGTGAFDRGNATEKYLDQAGLWEPLMQAQYGKTAAVSWGDDEPCKCCGGSGEHPSGHECHRCDASGEEKGAWGRCDAETMAKGAAIKLRCDDCGEDYFTDGEKHGCTEKTAAKHTVWDMWVRAKNRHNGSEGTILRGRMCEGHIAELGSELVKHNADPAQHTNLSIEHDTWPVDKSENPTCHTCVQRAVNDVFKTASGYETLYHLTDQHHFHPDAEKSPQDNAFAMQDRSHYKGLYVTDSPDTWRANGYHRPYVAEIHVPHGLARQERWHGEKFIPAEHFDKIKVNRVIPFDAHQREKYGEPGTVEEYHGTHYETDEPIAKTDWGHPAKVSSEPEAKDVRSFTPEEHTRHLHRLRDYLHDVQGYGWNEFNEKGEHTGLPYDDNGDEHRTDRDGNKMTRARYASKQARVHHPVEGPNGEPADGIMIALVPPKRVIDKLPLPENGEHPSNVHITLLYLGKITDFTKEQVEYLPELIESWGEVQKPLDATVQGVGTFSNPGSHVLWAAADIPGGNHMWVSLADTLKAHGYAFKENHGWTPHLTMSYEKHHVRFLPKIERMEFKVREVWCCIGGRWESFPLKGK